MNNKNEKRSPKAQTNWRRRNTSTYYGRIITSTGFVGVHAEVVGEPLEIL